MLLPHSELPAQWTPRKEREMQRISDMDRIYLNQVWVARRQMSKERHNKVGDPLVGSRKVCADMAQVDLEVPIPGTKRRSSWSQGESKVMAQWPP
jgi:hypothetical protein